MNLREKTIKGMGWSGLSQGLRIILQLVITAVLTRFLTPNDFGLLAMVAVFTNFVGIFSDFGLTAAIIQRDAVTEEHLSSSFWVNISTGVILTVFLILSAPAISTFYGQDSLTAIIRILALTFFISSFGIVQTTLFSKQLELKPLVIAELSAIALSGGTAIVLAYHHFGVWSLVWQQVVANAVNVVILWLFSNWHPKLVFKWQSVRELLGYSLNLAGFNLVNYFNRNLDNLLIGKLLGSSALGYYDLAYKMLLFPLQNITAVLGRVMFPALSRIKQDKEKVMNAYLKSARYIAVVAFPMVTGLAVVAPRLIPVLFGPQWGRSIFLIQVLSSIALIQSLGSTVGWLYQSQGRPDIQFKLSLFAIIVNATAFVVGARWDVEGVAVGYAVAQSLLAYPSFLFSFRLIGLKVVRYVLQVKSIFLAAIGMGCLVLAFRLVGDALGFGNITVLVPAVLGGVIIYPLLLLILDRPLLIEVFGILRLGAKERLNMGDQ